VFAQAAPLVSKHRQDITFLRLLSDTVSPLCFSSLSFFLLFYTFIRSQSYNTFVHYHPPRSFSSGAQCILFSVVLVPPPSATTAVSGSYLSSSYTLNLHCIAGAGLPIHIIGEVSWEPKRRRDLVCYSFMSSGGQNDDFRPLTSTLGGRGMGCRDKYVTS
jgi:hypothetical protein